MRLGTGLGVARPPCLSCLVALVVGSQICPSSSPRSRWSQRGEDALRPCDKTHQCPMRAHPRRPPGPPHKAPTRGPPAAPERALAPNHWFQGSRTTNRADVGVGGTGVWQPQHSSTHARHPGGSAELGVITQLMCRVVSAPCQHTTVEWITGSGRDSALESKRGAPHKLSESQLPPRNGPSDPFSGSL